MPRTPLLSVFIPAFNAEKYVREAVESVLDNGFADLEVVIVDDGSSDATAQVVESIRHPALRLIRQTVNLGEGPTRQRGLSALQGRYVAYLDADDVAVPGRFEKQVERLEAADSPDILGGGLEYFGDMHGTHFFRCADAEIRAELLFFSLPLANGTVCMKLAPFRDGRIRYWADPGPACDYALWVDAVRAGLRFENLPVVVIRYRRHNESQTRKLFDRTVAQGCIVRKRLAETYFPTMTGAEHDALVRALSYKLGGGQRWLDGVYAMSHAALLATSIPRIDASLMVRLLEEHLIGMIKHTMELGIMDLETLEMMTENNEHFERWRAAEGGALDVRVMALFE